MTAIAYDTPTLADSEDLTPDRDDPPGTVYSGPADKDTPPPKPSRPLNLSNGNKAQLLAQAPDVATGQRETPVPVIPAEVPSRQEAEEAVRVLIKWAGDDPTREGLIDTPARVAKAYREWFAGYDEDPETLLARTFEEVEGYDDIVLLRGIRLESYCEHHMAPIIGVAHVAYLPSDKVVGISKLARLVDSFSKRLQVQEKLTAQIADTLDRVLAPRGVAIMISAEHQCMSTRGVHKHGVDTVTTRYTGVFREDPKMEQRFLRLIQG